MIALVHVCMCVYVLVRALACARDQNVQFLCLGQFLNNNKGL